MKKLFLSFAVISALLLSPLCINAMPTPEPAPTEISEAQANGAIVIVTEDVIIIIIY